jgi:hypothetical protein
MLEPWPLKKMDLGPHRGPAFADQPLTALGRDFKGNRQQRSLPDLVRETSLNSPQADQWPFRDGRLATVHLC